MYLSYGHAVNLRGHGYLALGVLVDADDSRLALVIHLKSERIYRLFADVLSPAASLAVIIPLGVVAGAGTDAHYAKDHCHAHQHSQKFLCCFHFAASSYFFRAASAAPFLQPQLYALNS